MAIYNLSHYNIYYAHVLSVIGWNQGNIVYERIILSNQIPPVPAFVATVVSHPEQFVGLSTYRTALDKAIDAVMAKAWKNTPQQITQKKCHEWVIKALQNLPTDKSGSTEYTIRTSAYKKPKDI